MAGRSTVHTAIDYERLRASSSVNEGEDPMPGRDRPWLHLVAGAALAGCASASGASSDFGFEAGIEAAIEQHYSGRASERSGRCLHPFIDAITAVEVLEDNEHLVADVRYFFRDRLRDAGEDQAGTPCTGFAERRFTIARTEDGPKVIDMTGEQEEAYVRKLFRDLFF